MSKPYLQHLRSSDDLVTTYEAIRAGFVAQALEKNRKATPIVSEARALKASASRAANPGELLQIPDIRPALLMAAGLSDKATKHMQPQDKTEAIYGLIQNFLEPAGEHFIEELVFRFLLIRGDALGGAMRNLTGALAQRKLTRAIISALAIAGIPYQWYHKSSKKWIPMTDDDADIELSLSGLSWTSGEKMRTLIYNIQVPIIGRNNVDLCLFDCDPREVGPQVKKTPSRYIALGELKGGIDPAGADEHWKTAISALDRIRAAFAHHDNYPHIFFVGGAIAQAMANEIWKQLESGTLENAANLTDDDQIASVSSWLRSL